MIKVVKLVLGPLSSNCYLIFDEKSKEAVIVDPGDEADFLIQKIEDLELKPQKIIATHGHFDHVGAILDLKLIYQIPFLANKKDGFLLKRSAETSKYFTKIESLKLPSPDKDLKDGVKVILGKSALAVMETPGHTPGSVCLVGEGLAFVGDLLFADGSTGRCDFSYSHPGELKKSVKKILKLSPKTIVYPGHGPEFILGEIGSVNG